MFEKRIYADSLREYGKDDPRTMEAERRLMEKVEAMEEAFAMMDEMCETEAEQAIAEAMKETWL